MKFLYEKVEQWNRVVELSESHDGEDIVNYVEDVEPTDAIETILYEFVDSKNGEEQVLCSSGDLDVVMNFIRENHPDFYKSLLEE